MFSAAGLKRLRKKWVAAALRRHHTLQTRHTWRGRPAATCRRLGFSAACEAPPFRSQINKSATGPERSCDAPARDEGLICSESPTFPILGRVDIRFYLDSATGQPHILEHGVAEEEVRDVLTNPGEDRPGREGARVVIGQTAGGRYLKVVYVRDPKLDSIFVITAYELRGKPLRAYRRRLRGRQR